MGLNKKELHSARPAAVARPPGREDRRTSPASPLFLVASSRNTVKRKKALVVSVSLFAAAIGLFFLGSEWEDSGMNDVAPFGPAIRIAGGILLVAGSITLGLQGKDPIGLLVAELDAVAAPPTGKAGSTPDENAGEGPAISRPACCRVCS